MRVLSSELLANQASLNRKPISQIVARDVMLRFSNFTEAAYSVGYPSETDGNNIPRAQIDMDVWNGHIYRAWCIDSTTLRIHDCDNPGAEASWQYANTESCVTDGMHRPSTVLAWTFYGHSGNIKYVIGTDTFGTFRSSAYTVTTNRIALAAVSHAVVYMACLHIDTDFKYISLHRVTPTGVVDCPHTIIVDRDYNESSLSWFDAETLDNRDVIVLNERAHGHPVIILYEDGVWSQPRPILPLDIVDNYSFLRIAGLSVIPEAVEGSGAAIGLLLALTNPTGVGEMGNVLWATGRLGRKGSTGRHPQEFDVVLRSKDGEHWTFDRYCYACQDNMRSRFMVHDGYVYYANGSVVKRARQAWLAGGDPGELKWLLSDDILEWTYQQPTVGTACRGTVKIADHAGDYDEVLRPGYWLWRYAGYNNETSLIATEAIDRVPVSYQAGARKLSLQTRDIAMRSMTDWASSQDWQWLSQQKHYDDCDKMDCLYSIGAASIEVPDQDDVELTGSVTQDELSETDNNVGLEFKAYNKPGIFLCTKPYDARNFVVRGRFQFSHSSADTAPGGLGLNLSPGERRTPRIGNGFGVVGCVKDQHNLVAAFCDIADENLYILRRRGNKDYSRWTVLIGPVALSHYPGTETDLVKDEMYDVEFFRSGRRLHARVVHFDTDASRRVLAAVGYDWALDEPMIASFTWNEGTSSWDLDDLGDWELHDHCRVGVLCNISVAETKVERIQAWQDYFPRAAGHWDDPLIESQASSDDYADFSEGKLLHIGDEKLEIFQRTASNWKSRYFHASSHEWSFWGEPVTYGNQVIWAHTTYGGREWRNDHAGFAWILSIVDGPGTGINMEVFDIGNTSDGKGVFVVGIPSSGNGDNRFVPADEWKKIRHFMEDNMSGAYAYFHVLPGFHVKNQGGGRRGNSPSAKAYPLGTIVRQHADDLIRIRGVWAYDDEFDKSLECILRDIATKAGVLDFDVGTSIDTSVAVPNAVTESGPAWLSGVEQRDFDLTITLPSVLSAGQAIGIIARSTSNSTLHSGGVWDLTNVAAIAAGYGLSGDGTPYISTAQTSQSGANEADWVTARIEYLDASVVGKRLRFVGHENFVAIYLNDMWLRTFHFGPIYGYDTDGYDNTVEGPGYIGLYGVGTSPIVTVTQPELYAWTDGIILDQRMNAVAGLKRAIRDRRVKFFSKADGSLKISLFDTRDKPQQELDSEQGNLSYGIHDTLVDDAQDFGDWETLTGDAAYRVTVVNTDETTNWAYIGEAMAESMMPYQDIARTTTGWNGTNPAGKTPASYIIEAAVTTSDQIYQDEAGPTDRILTHIRVSGEEEAEYIDHVSAAEYGLLFALAQCPSLDEEEAYAEARRIVEDTVSQAGARRSTMVAQLNWEVEDEISVCYVPADGGPTIDADYIVDTMNLRFRPGDLQMNAMLRKKHIPCL